ncbi:ADP-ribosylglycohydrolase family protein [Clostridiales bacterium COT073_COT-073]|nr:ADP-ribosylglycohydrolase family protein [Clostridiales bacterium COT073_COT-073]
MIRNYLEKVYAGFLGMNIGIRLGAPVEPLNWTYERIYKTYGDITDYVKDYKNFAADDDANGPVYFLRALVDEATDGQLTPQQVANAWLNYAREGVGMFWWGGYGVSTEHTAYLNLKKGIPAPQSGSIAQNGQTVAEQIGGQIFIDTWGLVCPADPDKAADFGEAAASVSHDGNGIYGARFFCACIAEAFVENDIQKIIERGLQSIPKDSTYAQVTRAVIDFYRENPNDWRACMQMLFDHWGYDRYPGVCHIIPNAGVCILAMLYGRGKLDRTVEIATMCGWDTDCNAGNVGTVLGVVNGIAGVPEHYRRPINDGLILSGISGYLNNLNIPNYVKEVAALGYALAGETMPEEIRPAKPGELHFDFELPGSTHNLRVSDPFFCRLFNTDEKAYQGKRSLKILVDEMARGEQCKIYYKPFYRREDLSDERYSPVFTPTVYPGQTMSLNLYLEQWQGWENLGIAPYVRSSSDKKEHVGGFIKLIREQWLEVIFTIPEVGGDLIDEVGIIIEGYSPAKSKSIGMIYLDDMKITGKAKYQIAIAKQHKELGVITPFSMDHGAWVIEEEKLSLMRCEPAFAYAGNYYATDYQVTSRILPLHGDSHLLQIRAQGAMRGYQAGFTSAGKVGIYKNNFGYQLLAETEYPWEKGQEYEVCLSAQGSQIQLSIDGQIILSVSDESFSYGMYGCGSLSMGRTLFGDFAIIEKESK